MMSSLILALISLITFTFSVASPINQSINQSTNQSINQSIKPSDYPPCTVKFDSSHRYLTLSNGLFESLFDASTGEQLSWLTPQLVDSDGQLIDYNLLLHGNAQWNSDRGDGADYVPHNMEVKIIVNNEDMIHIAFVEPNVEKQSVNHSINESFNQSINQSINAEGHPNLPYFDWSFHYVIERGLTGMYTWSILQRNQSINPSIEPYQLVEYRYTVRLSRGTADSHYQDAPFDHVKISDSFNTSRLQPNYQQCIDGLSFTVPGEPKEVEYVKLNDGSQVYLHKYDTCLRALEHKIHGWYNETDHRGIWIVTPDYSYHNGNFMNQELTSYGPTTGTGSLFAMLQYTSATHYGSGEEGIRIDVSDFKKIYGPFLVYANQGSSNDATWDDAWRQWKDEKYKWPYSFVDDVDYSCENRGEMYGMIHVSEYEIDVNEENQAGTLVVLSAPEAINGPMKWQSNGYWYSNYTDSDGKFHIQHIMPGLYELHVFKNGTFGNYTHSKLFNVTKKSMIDVGPVDWKPSRYGVTLWDIGRPDLDSREFAHGLIGQTWGMWNRFPRYFPNGINYAINMSQSREQQREQWQRDWYYEQVPVSSDPLNATAKWSDVTWNITFYSISTINQFKQMSLRIGLAGLVRCGLSVSLNGQHVVDWFDLHEWNDMCVYRDQTYGQYNMKEVNMSTSLLTSDMNVMSLTTSCGPAPMYGNGIQYDYLRLELFDSLSSNMYDQSKRSVMTDQ